MEKEEIDRFILEITGAKRLKYLGIVQTLWSGYGSIVRIGLEGSDVPSVIVKHVQPEGQVVIRNQCIKIHVTTPYFVKHGQAVFKYKD